MAQTNISHVRLLSLFLCVAFSPVYCFYLNPDFYEQSFPKAEEIVRSVVAKLSRKRLGWLLNCSGFISMIVLGCDASLLLDNSRNINYIISEKQSNSNRNSTRGFEVIDDIKSAALEKECPQTVSCADVLALAARDSTAGGTNWAVPLGRRDSKSASLSGSNSNIPQPNNTFQTILTKFKVKGLNIVDLVALSGSHTIGNARCTSFRQRLYNQSGNGQARSGGDNNMFSMVLVSPTKFDNYYFKNILASKGLFNSDQVLLTKDESSMDLVKQYAENNNLFFEQFAKSMVKMGNLSPLTGSDGEIRKNCRRTNSGY
ncbi:hypothetical protein MKX01_009990 [Papaver californicum]|nr:hypothetical protein MKX01_009990 [Papaver californicum]